MRTKLPTPEREAFKPNPTLRLSRILAPMDFSSCSQKALGYAKALAHQFGAQLILMNVVEPYPPTGDLALDLARIQLNLEEHAQSNLEKYRSIAGPNAQMVVRVGSPAHAITEEAKKLNADLIILATHGRTGLAHFALGSVAERVVRHAPCPVLVVRENERDFIASEPRKVEHKSVPAAKGRKTNHKLMEAV